MIRRSKYNALIAYCHAIPKADGSIDPHQPYMGVICLSVRKGPVFEKVNIIANTTIVLKMVYPGIRQPVNIVTLRNGSLKQFKETGKMIYKPFKTFGISNFEDHLGVGFYDYINVNTIKKIVDKLPADSTYSVCFTVDINGKSHRLKYDYNYIDNQFENNAFKIDDSIDYNQGKHNDSA